MKLRTLLSSTALVGATFLLAAPALAQDKQEVEITEKARRHFRAGVAFVEDPDGARYIDALREFKAAYKESPSWKILGNLGLAALKLERDGEAILALKTYLAEGGDEVDPGERAQFQRDINTMEASVTWVKLTSNLPPGRLIDSRVPLSGAEKLNAYDMDGTEVKIGVRAGRHKITIELEGYESQTWTFDATGGEVSHHFELVEMKEATPTGPVQPTAQPEDQYETSRPVPTSVWIGAGVTGALAIGGTVTGIMATGKQSDFEDANDGSDPAAAQDLRDEGQTLNLVTDIMFGGAIAGGVVTTILYLTRPEVKTKVSSVQVSPTALPGGGGVWVHGNF